jgi:hypothetical protein
VQLTEDHVLLFVHIPKTGGVTLTRLLRRRFPDEQVLPITDRRDHAKMLRELDPEALAKIRLVAGHFWFGPGDRGVHDLLDPNPVKITLLRDPVDRAISSYRHIAGRPGHPAHQMVAEGGGTLLDFVRSPMTQGHVRNVQARQVVGTPPEELRRRVAEPRKALSLMPDDELLSLAKRRLDEFAFVGLQERFDESLALLAGTFGWEPFDTSRRWNEAPSQSPRPEVSEEARQEILRLTEVDRALYDHAELLFDRRLEPASGRALRS